MRVKGWWGPYMVQVLGVVDDLEIGKDVEGGRV